MSGRSGGGLEAHKFIQLFHDRRYGAWMISLAGDDQLVRDLAHGGEVVLGVLDVLESPGVVGLAAALNQVLKSLLVVEPRIPLGILELGGLGGLGGSLGRLARARLVVGLLRTSPFLLRPRVEVVAAAAAAAGGEAG